MKGDFGGLPAGTLSGLPQIKINGNSSVEVVNHKGIRLYTDVDITVSTKLGDLSICGNKLIIKEIDPEILKIEGAVYQVMFKNFISRNE